MTELFAVGAFNFCLFGGPGPARLPRTGQLFELAILFSGGRLVFLDPFAAANRLCEVARSRVPWHGLSLVGLRFRRTCRRRSVGISRFCLDCLLGHQVLQDL
jgi:hypothetical protein